MWRMRGKSVIVHTLDSFHKLAVEPMEKLTNKPAIKPTLTPAISTRPYHLPSA